MKIEVGKKYELNNGEVHECTHMRDDDPLHVDCYGYGPFVINDILYHQDGRFADADADHEYSVKREVLTVQAGKYYRTRDGRKVGPMVYEGVFGDGYPFTENEIGGYWSEFGKRQNIHLPETDLIAEWTEPKTGTLAELDVKPGDVVECVRDFGNKNYTLGKKYTINEKGETVQDDGCACNGRFSIFRIISRASDTPKTWGQMTDAEKGEMLLARYEGKVIEVYIPITDETGEVLRHEWVFYQGEIGNKYAYRIKPEPVRETVTLWWEQGCVAGRQYYEDTTHRITFTTTDGEPDLDSIKMEEV